MTRWLRDLMERLLGRYYEQLQAPKRYAELVVLFAQQHPETSREELLTFARRLAESAYREGYVRGWENAAREDLDLVIDPETIADLHDPKWRRRVGAVYRPNGGIRILRQDELLSDEEIEERDRA